ncbi:MAG: right-handed parallel beta-helix repeat-containing protein [Acidobacteria bacterium]|nr:right-handed parallel beta-helix repeat-containing protein [Acidobacteriota bacterium]
MKTLISERPWLLLLWTALIALFAPAFWSAVRDYEPTSQASGENVIDARRYPNLQAALDALPASGGIVTLPPGDHRISKPLEVTRGDVRIQGCGPATHLVNENKEGRPALILRPPERPAANQEMNGPRIWRTHVADLRISGNPQSGDGLLAVGVNELYVHDLFIDHNGGHGICLADCYENPRITDCNITYNGGAGIHLKSKSWNPVITSNHFEENRDGVEALRIFNICMTGNSFDDHLRHGVIVEDSWGGIVVGNVIEQCAGIGMVLDRNCYGMNVSSNMFGQNTQGGLEVRGAWGCTVSANTFCINANRALVVGPGSGRITITGNNFGNGYVGPDVKPRDFPASGLILEGTRDISVTGNTFAGLATEAIRAIGPCRRLVVLGNIFTDLPAGKSGMDLGELRETLTDMNLKAETQ